MYDCTGSNIINGDNNEGFLTVFNSSDAAIGNQFTNGLITFEYSQIL